MADMELTEFSELLEMQGSRLADWPEADFARASVLLEASESARALLQETVAFEAELDSFQAPAPSAELRGNILAEAEQMLKSRILEPSSAKGSALGRLISGGLSRLMQPIAVPALATWLLVAALGVASGAALSSPQMSDEQILAYYGVDRELWVDALALDSELQNGSGS